MRYFLSFAVAGFAAVAVPGCAAETQDACVCNNTWSYPTDYNGGSCVGPLIGCPSTPCDGDGDGAWCVVKDQNCKGVQEYSDGGRKYHYAYCHPTSPTGLKLAANDIGIRYIGRFDFTNPQAPRFAWSMAGVSVAFHGSNAVYGTFSFPKAGGRLRVIVDGAPVGFVQQGKGKGALQQFLLAENLDSSKSYTFEVYKVTEDGDMTFGGFQLASGSFDSAPRAPARRMEFIGDSDTAGWCADGSSKTGDDANAYEDAYVTWAQQIARHLGAEAMVEAVSGWGVTKSSTPIQEVLDYSIRFKPRSAWDYSKWTPDAVVILIGPNDFNDESLIKTQGKSFIKQYKGLLDMVALNYKKSETPPKVIHVCGGSGNGFDPCHGIQTANTEFNQEQEQSGSGIKGFYTTISKSSWAMINGPNGKGTSQYNGCDSHYSEKGHSVLALEILPQIKKIMGWEALVVV